MAVMYQKLSFIFFTQEVKTENNTQLTIDDNVPKTSDPNRVCVTESYHAGRPSRQCRAYKILFKM
jgi:hypothetical protein